MWESMGSKHILELKPACEIDGLKPDQVRFIELLGSGAGDQYLFQGHFILLGKNEGFYNLGIYSLGPTWTVHDFKIGSKMLLSPEERWAGRDLARKLALTLPDLTQLGFRHSREWLQQAWEHDRTRSYDEELNRLILRKFLKYPQF